MVIDDEALYLAGLALAHALWSASDLEGDDMVVPLAFVRDGVEIKLLRFESDTQEQAIRSGHERMQELRAEGKAWAFARDGIVREENVPVDVIVVEAWATGSDDVATIVQRYVPYARDRRFRLQGPMQLALAGNVIPTDSAGGALAVVRDGVFSHTAVAEIFPTWQAGG